MTNWANTKASSRIGAPPVVPAPRMKGLDPDPDARYENPTLVHSMTPLDSLEQLRSAVFSMKRSPHSTSQSTEDCVMISAFTAG